MALDIGTAIANIGGHWANALSEQERVKMEKEKQAFSQMMQQGDQTRQQGYLDLAREQQAQQQAKQLFDQTLALVKEGPSRPLSEQQFQGLDQRVAPSFFRESQVPQGAVRDLQGNPQAGEVLPGFGQAGKKEYYFEPGESEKLRVAEANQNAAFQRAMMLEQGRNSRFGQDQALDTQLANLRADVSRDIAGMRIDAANARSSQIPVIIQTPQGTQVLTRDEALKQGQFDLAPTAEQRNKEAGRKSAGAVLDSIDELSTIINTQEGLMAKLSGGVEKQKAQLNYNHDVAEYEAVISGFTPLLARAVGHTGVLTEQDVQSVRKMFPAPGDAKELRDRKIARIRKIMGAVSATVPGNDDATPPRPDGGQAPPGGPTLSNAPRKRERYDPATGKFIPVS